MNYSFYLTRIDLPPYDHTTRNHQAIEPTMKNSRLNGLMTLKCELFFQITEQSYLSLFTLTIGFILISVKRLLCNIDYEPMSLRPGFHYTTNATTTTQKQSDYEVEQSSFTLIALFWLEIGRCRGRNWLSIKPITTKTTTNYIQRYTRDILHGTHDIPHGTEHPTVPSTPHGTAHILYRVVMKNKHLAALGVYCSYLQPLGVYLSHTVYLKQNVLEKSDSLLTL